MSDEDIRRWAESQKQDDRPVGELVRLALTEEDSELAWQPIITLQCRGTREVLEAARSLCTSVVADERRVGADILGQLGIPERSFPEECFGLLSGMLKSESDSDVLNSIGVAFGHLREPRAVPLLAPLRNHEHKDVRAGVVHGLMTQTDPLAIVTLIALSTDPDDYVRDWSTFALGSMIDSDTPEIRDALAARLDDPCKDAQGEAMVGLARRKDSRAIPPILRELSADGTRVYALDAAEEMASSELYPALLALQAEVNALGEEAGTHFR